MSATGIIEREADSAVAPAQALVDRWNRCDEAGRTRHEAAVTQLRRARSAGAPLSPELRDLRGLRLVDEDLSGLDLSGLDLGGADLSRADLSGARLVGTRLAGAVLFEADLTRAEMLQADLSRADLSRCKAEECGLGRADLSGAQLFGARLAGASFTGAKLRGADLRTASLPRACLREVDLREANFSRSDLARALLDHARVDHAVFVEANLSDVRMRKLEGYAKADWIGANIQGVDFCGAYLARRTILDQNFLHEFRTESRVNGAIYWAWWATSDCGRSFVRWGLWTLLLTVVFAGLYELVLLDYGDHRTPLSSLYYSVVTLTTLGYGDVLPASTGAQLLAMVQVALGYMMLGGLLSIFSNKMARRAD